ncbi:MAG: hypothetical protein AABZ60_01970 [Planctomycetota bacterium]
MRQGLFFSIVQTLFWGFLVFLLGIGETQEFYYGFYQEETLVGYLNTQLLSSWQEGKECIELRRILYTRGKEDQEERIHAILSKQGELQEISQRIRRKAEEFWWTARVQANQVEVVFQNQGVSKSWNLAFSGKLYFSFQSYLWCNPQFLKPGTAFTLQTLQLSSVEQLPQLGKTQVNLENWISGQASKTLRFKSQNEGQKQWMEGLLDGDGNMLESSSYFEGNKPLFCLKKAERSLLEQFGPSGIRLPMDLSIYGTLDELEIEGPSLPFQASPYLEIRQEEGTDRQILILKRVQAPYREEQNASVKFWDESLFQNTLKTVLKAPFPIVEEGELREKRTDLLLLLLKNAGIVARLRQGFRLEGKEWVYYPWIEIDRGMGWEPYFFEENRFCCSANYFYPGLAWQRWSEFLGKTWNVRRVIKDNEEIGRSQFLQMDPSFHQRFWGLKFKKPLEVDYIPSVPDQLLLADNFGSYLLITACPFNPEFVEFSWFDLYVKRLLNTYPEKQLLNRSVNQIDPHRKMIELHFTVPARKESDPLSIRVFMTSRGLREGLLFVLICKEKYLEKVKLWFEPWLTSVSFK